MCCTHSNIWVELFWNSVVNTTKPLISSCVLFWKPKQSAFAFTMKHSVSRTWRRRQQQYYSENKITPSFFAYTFGRCFANLPTQWRRHVGRVWMSCFRGAWSSLNFDKEYLFGFETLVFATSGILSMHNQLVNTPKRKKNLKSHHMTPLNKRSKGLTMHIYFHSLLWSYLPRVANNSDHVCRRLWRYSFGYFSSSLLCFVYWEYERAVTAELVLCLKSGDGMTM